MAKKFKNCSSCNQFLSESSFYSDKRNNSGLSSDCKFCHTTRVRHWQKCNPEKFKSDKAKYQKAHPEQTCAKTLRWQTKHPGYCRAQYQNYMTRQIFAMPSWVNAKDITAVYNKCQAISKRTGILHHVDHIIPLRGKLVSGLHIPWNLQILSAHDNCSKSNKFICEKVA